MNIPPVNERKSQINISTSMPKASAIAFNVSIVGFLFPVSIWDRYEDVIPTCSASSLTLIPLYSHHAWIG